MEHLFESREEASLAAAGRIAECLRKFLDAQQRASLVVSGGTTPVRCFEALSDIALDWSGVHVLLSDERWVPPSGPDSNERLVRENLLQNRAADASLLASYDPGSAPVARCAALSTEILRLPIPFACSLLGMGNDGHFASLFPDAEGLDEGLRTDSDKLCMAVRTAASPHPRLSLTLAAIARSDVILLLIFGDEKRRVIDAAMQPGSRLPVAHLLRQKRAPVSVFWAP